MIDDRGWPPPIFTKEGAFEKWLEELDELFAEGGKGSGWFAPPKGTHGLQDGVGEAAAQKRAEAEKQEPAITKAVAEAVADVGGELFGLESRFKSEASLRRKIADDVKTKGLSASDAADKINDVVRYTALFEPDRYFEGVAHVQAALEGQGWKQYDEKWKNFWAPGDQYDGYNTVMINEAGERFELQFHTPESIEIKMKIHPLYERARELPPGLQRAELDHKMTAMWIDSMRPEDWKRLSGIQVVKR